MKKILVWDLSVRLFHWTFAASLLAALGFAFFADKHGALFRWHMVAGIVAVFLLVLRIVMGVVGSRYARFTRFPLRPVEVARYFPRALTGDAPRYVGHNPGCALAALAMFFLVLVLFATGLNGSRDPWEDLHGALAYALLAVIGAHLVGLIWHAVRHRENVVAPMISGRKEGRPEDGLASSHPVWAAGLVVVATAWIGGLLANYDAATSRIHLPLTGATIQLGENDGREKEHVKEKRKFRDH
jgi:cytochrome b